MMRWFNRWRRDRRGVSAVEFAFIAPLLILSYFGVAELCGALLAQRKAGHVASEIGDLVAQTGPSQTLAMSDFTNFWSVGGAVMYPLSPTPLKIRLTSINADSTGKVFKVGWSEDNGAGLTKYPVGTDLTSSVPAGVIQANGSIIKAETVYTYTSPVAIVVKTAIPFSSTFYLSPRQTTVIPCPTCS